MSVAAETGEKTERFSMLTEAELRLKNLIRIALGWHGDVADNAIDELHGEHGITIERANPVERSTVLNFGKRALPLIVGIVIGGAAWIWSDCDPANAVVAHLIGALRK